ncbi:hypothetical protein BJX66DRAFT_336123 [Aspergillus keveii]|uniref:Uncharacterized protein n=1 Tax=Aspergillus keveii TaxID=714993 RepID=A0ABR4GBF9_9EURO
MDQVRLGEISLDLDDEETAHGMAVRDGIFANGPKSNDPLRPVRRIRIETIVAGLISEFDRYARKDERGDSVALRQWTDWKAQGGHPFGQDVDALHSPSRIWWVINPTYWVNSRIPHLKFIVESDIKDVSDRLLLQTELLAIVAASRPQSTASSKNL